MSITTAKRVQGYNKTYQPITQGCAAVLKILFEIYHGLDGLEKFATKHELNPNDVHAWVTTCQLPIPFCKKLKAIGWFYDSKLGYSILIKYPVKVARHLVETSMTLDEFAAKHKLNKVLVKNFFNENPILSQMVLNACKTEGVWYECYTKTPLELRQLAKERINDDRGGLQSYMISTNFPHRDTFWGYFYGECTPDALEKLLKRDGYLIR